MGIARTFRRNQTRKHDRDVKRRIRRTAGMLAGYFCADLLGRIADPRSAQGRTWKSCLPLVKAATLGLAAGCKGLREVEEITSDMFASTRELLGIPRAVPDTTLRDFLCELDPEQLSDLIYVAGYDAWRRRAYHPIDGFGFHAVSLDGKYPTLRDVGDSKCKNYEKSKYLQVHHDKDGNPTHGTVRTINGTLITAEGRPLLSSVPVLGDTNEMGSFNKAFGDLVRVYGKLFKLVMYDAGAASGANANVVRKTGKHFLFQIADERWVMYDTVRLLLQDKDPMVRREDFVSDNERYVREMKMMSVTETSKNLTMWEHVRTIFSVYTEHWADGVLKATKIRYYVCSMDASELSAEKWLDLIIKRWGVETVHQILDMPRAFDEDKHPWITKDARGALAVMLLRRLVYAIMTLHKAVHLRADNDREAPWRRLTEWVRDVLKWPNAEELEGLRSRTFAVPPAFA